MTVVHRISYDNQITETSMALCSNYILNTTEQYREGLKGHPNRGKGSKEKHPWTEKRPWEAFKDSRWIKHKYSIKLLLDRFSCDVKKKPQNSSHLNVDQKKRKEKHQESMKSIKQKTNFNPKWRTHRDGLLLIIPRQEDWLMLQTFIT